MPKKYNKIVIGIDQSYTRTGISICADGTIIKSSSINFKGLNSRSSKRKHLANVIYRILSKASQMALQTIILCERIRTNSPTKGKEFGIRPDYLKMTGALIATIVDTADEFNVPVYSVDTRSWKSKIVGSSKADKKGNTKMPTVNWVQNKLGIDLFVREKKTGKNKGERMYDDDQADAICISLYGFIKESDQKIKQEL